MVILKQYPQGLDAPIQQLQVLLNDYLVNLWAIDDAQYNCYGKAYRNLTRIDKTEGYIPEVYLANGEYKEAFYDDTVIATSFFGLNNGRATYNGATAENTASIHLIFAVDLPKIYVDSRNDEAAHSDVQRFLELYQPGANIERITDLDRVYSDYSGWKLFKNLRESDMHPRHVFRFNFDLTFDTDYCPQPLIYQPIN